MSDLPDAVGVLGAGLVGRSWAALYAARGLRVVVVDPDPGAEAALRAFLPAALDDLAALGLAAAAPTAPAFATDPAALSGLGFVQENGPDRLEAKRALLTGAERWVAEDAVLASSTSSLLPSDIQAGLARPERLLVAHPMNPPHLVPMVELVAGRLTAPATVERAAAFYEAHGRVVIRVAREVVGHLANRLTSALYREAVHCVAEGIATVEDVDRAIAHGPGLRWALMGPHAIYHLGGGAGGYRAYLDHLGPTQEARWAEHGTPRLTPALKDALVAGVEAELAGEDPEALARRRDAALVALLTLKARHGF
ncbi:MAG: 3-hydroxyacyl-CoA dehydrogenase NAD-binding domain-containing protein [Paracoccaceae bacterium]